MSQASAPVTADLAARWALAWPEALALWSRFTRLRPPQLCATRAEARLTGLSDSFAMIRLTDQLVVVDLEGVAAAGLADLPLEILGHEIGHHILCPASLTDHGRMLARMRWALPGVERAAPAVANLYADLHINDRLQRDRGLRLDEVYRRLNRPGPPAGGLWLMYQRMYEILWGLPRGDLAPGPLPDRIEGDASLGSRLVRAYRTEWLDGAAGFAALCLPYLAAGADHSEAAAALSGWGDALDTTGGAVPDGLVDLDPAERSEPVHPAHDPRVSDGAVQPGRRRPGAGDSPAGPGGQHREPFEYGELLRALGLDLSDHDAAVRYYREAARPHLVPFPARPVPPPGEVVPEGLAPWTVGEPLAAIDWLHTLLRSPVPIPGVTTVQRVYGTGDAAVPRPEAVDLDLYVDSSGSMANPQVALSYPALAGTILALSCLRAGGRVQATLWSGAGQFETTGAFVSDAEAVLRILTGFIGGATAFPIHLLRDTYAPRRPGARPVHVLVVSDDGVTTMFDRDEHGGDGAAIARAALAGAGGGGTMVLNLGRRRPAGGLDAGLEVARAMGWDVAEVDGWEALVAFARRFARRAYGART